MLSPNIQFNWGNPCQGFNKINKVTLEGTINKKRNDKTHLKVNTKRIKKIDLKVIKDIVVKTNSRIIKKNVSNILTKKNLTKSK